MSRPIDNQTFLDALSRLEGTSYEFEGYLSNHGPMASEALIALGAADAVLDWVDIYKVRLDVEPEPHEPIQGGGQAWRSALGDMNRVADWSVFFQRELAAAPWPDVLTVWWPRLLPGMVAAATHGIIRVAHAVRAIDRAAAAESLLLDELAHGLGYWAARYQQLPGGSPLLKGNGSLGEAMDRVACLDPSIRTNSPGILSSLLLVNQTPGYDEALASYGLADEVDKALSELTAHAARAFLAHPGPAIPMVHAITGPAAARLVLPHLPPRLHRDTLARSWQVSAAIVAAFASPVAVQPKMELMDEVELVSRVVEHGDEHVIKVTEACVREHQLNPDPHYLLAAEAALRTIDPIQ